MKTNFKKAALTAGMTAALAVGSMSAHAIMTGVPGEASLVPLFYFSGADAALNAQNVNTVIRITVPKSVGQDSVMALTAPHVTKPDAESTRNPVLSGSVKYTRNVQTVDINQFPKSRVHWFYMDINSNELQDGTIDVSADDDVITSAAELVPAYNGTTCFPASNCGSGNPGHKGYLILTTETAHLGTADADFAFGVDAWLAISPLTPGQDTFLPEAIAIPTFAMADGADTTDFPVPGNHVVERTSSPVASPITTGIRVGAMGHEKDLKVIDIPLANRNSDPNLSNGGNGNLVVVWNDSNRKDLTFKAQEFGGNETSCSTTLPLQNQLNVVYVPDIPSALLPVIPFEHNSVDPTKAGGPGFVTQLSYLCGTLDMWGYNDGVNTHTHDGLDDGFVKLFVKATPVPTGYPLADGAYSAMVAFTIPYMNFTNVTVDKGVLKPTGGPLLTWWDALSPALDLGWFKSQ